MSVPGRPGGAGATRRQWVGWTGAMLAASVLAGAAAGQPVAPEGWACRFCPLESGQVSTWSLGSGFVSDASGKFGDYTGLNEDGFYLLADGELRYWGETGSYWALLLADLGLESRSLALDGGQPGVYRLRLGYDEIPKYRIDDAVTPYRGIGGSALSLPGDWVPAGSTADLTALGRSLTGFDVAQRRKALGLGLTWLGGGPLDYRVDYRREERTGTELLAGNFAASSAWLPAPIDYVTDELELSLSHSSVRGGFEVALLRSEFSNGFAGLTWQNAFTPLAEGADFGRSALAPDNEAEQLRVAGHYRIGSTTHVSASFASGRLEQDDVFASLSANPEFADATLPRSSLAGKVDTRHLNLSLVAQPFRRLRLVARYDRHERDNRTAQAVYDTVLTDLVAAGPRINIPYGFERSDTSVQVDYRLPHDLGLKAGLERDVHERSFQSRERTEESSAWAKLTLRGLDWAQATVGWTDRSRDGADYRQVDLGASLQNPLLRQYHLADRDQRIAELDLTIIPHERVNLLLRAERTRDEYSATALGLTGGNSSHFSFDASFELPNAFNAYASWGREQVEFAQAGSQGYASPDWLASTEDTTQMHSLGLTKTLLDARVRVSFDLTDSRSRGATRVLVGVPATGFPDFTSDLESLNLRVDYEFSESLSLRAGYRHERYSSADWQLDGLRPATIPNVLTIGAASPRYRIDMLTLSFAYTPTEESP